eukprot:489960-Rhodomonas_salina.1
MRCQRWHSAKDARRPTAYHNNGVEDTPAVARKLPEPGSSIGGFSGGERRAKAQDERDGTNDRTR